MNYRPSNNYINMESINKQLTFDINQKIPNTIECSSKPKRKYCCIFDTETSEFYNDILQLAYVICDESGKIIKEKSRYVKNRIPSIESEKIHKISKEKLKIDGEDFFQIIKDFIKDLDSCHTVIGHNINYDITAVNNDVKTYGVNVFKNKIPLYNVFDGIKIEDTMTIYGKKIKLEELYKQLFNKKIDQAHNALYDVLATKECYFTLKQNKANNHDKLSL